MANNNYMLLVCYNFHGKEYDEIIDGVLRYGEINYQIPSNSSSTKMGLVGWTALHIAQKIGDKEGFQKLIENGADCTITNEIGLTALHPIIQRLFSNPKELTQLRKMIDLVLTAHIQNKNCLNPQTKSGLSHFHAACMRSRTKAVKLFLKDKDLVNQAVGMDAQVYAGFTPLHFAADFCSFQVAKLLLNRGADVSRKDARGLTSLHLLIKRNMEIIDWVNMGKRHSWNNLKKVYERNQKVIQIIFEKLKNNDCDILDELQLSYLHVACTLKDTSQVEQLCIESIDLNKQVPFGSPLWSGYTPLHFAAHFNTKIVKLLLEKGADISIKNSDNITPFNLCIQRCNVKDISEFIALKREWKNIRFFNSKIKLNNALLAMQTEKMFNSFLQKATINVNMSIAFNSPLWPGATLLHLTILFSERCRDITDLCKYNLHYLEEPTDEAYYNCKEEEEDLFLERIKICLKLGADITIKDFNGSTPLHLAFQLQKWSAVNLLLQFHKGIVNSVAKDGLSDLHIACATGNTTLVENLLSHDADMHGQVMTHHRYHVNHDGERIHFDICTGSTPLHVAVASQNIEIVKKLVNHGADIYAKDTNGCTPIHQVLLLGLKGTKDLGLREISQILMLSDDLQECVTSFGLSHLHVASYSNNSDAIKKLLDEKRNIDEKISSSFSVNKNLYFLNNFNGFTPLHLSLKNECEGATKMLVDGGADILAKAGDAGYDIHKMHSNFLAKTVINNLANQEKLRRALNLTRLHSACASLETDQVRELLNKGANPNVQVREDSPVWAGYTPLHFLMMKREHYPLAILSQIIELLLDHEADVTIVNTENNTAIQSIFHDGIDLSFNFIGQLLRGHRNVCVNSTNNNGLSHFHVACLSNKMEFVNKFLSHGVDPNQIVDYDSNYIPGYSPLHIAAYLENSELTEFLLRHGGDLRAKNSFYKTPLDEAIHFYLRRNTVGRDATVQSLIKAKADLETENIFGKIPLEYYFEKTRPTTGIFKSFLIDQDYINIFNPRSGVGLLAMAFFHEKNIDKLLENSVYEILINKPEKNGADIMGRIPIHNIISIRSMPTPVPVYAAILRQMISLGFDINHQDSQGRTALHIAVQFKNLKGVQILLQNGVDINITDVHGKTALSYILPWLKIKTISSRKPVFRLFTYHLRKMERFKIYMSRVNNRIHVYFKNGWKKPESVEVKWKLEEKKLIEESVGTHNITLHNFLSETAAVGFYLEIGPSQRKIIDNYFQKNIEKIVTNFPVFCGLLLLQYRKAWSRMMLIIVARDALNNLFKYKLPDLCCNFILKFLCNDELQTIIETCAL